MVMKRENSICKLVSWLLIGFQVATKVHSFATPNTDFLLTIDENSVAVGHEHTCVIEQKHGENSIGGKVTCWGGDSDSGRDEAPSDIDFVQIVAAQHFSCGITLEQTAICWGKRNGDLPGLYKQLTSSSHADYVCGVLIDGRINCMGSGLFLGHMPILVTSDVKYVQISCGGHHCCALDSNAYPHCWGYDHVGQSSPPTITHTEYQESLRTNGNNFLLKKIASEELIEDEEISFTRKSKRTSTDEPEAISADDFVESIAKMQFRQISVGGEVSCGITLIGNHLRCWGRAAEDHTYPRYVMGPFRQVSAGDMGLCVVAAEVEEGQEHPSEVEQRLREQEEEEWVKKGVTDKKALIKRQMAQKKRREINRTPDTLTCWGSIQGSGDFQPHIFEGWDTIILGSGIFCGVSLDSELHCSGIHIPEQYRDFHKHFLVA